MDVTLDPDTSFPKLILSDDRKQVTSADFDIVLRDNPERFNLCSLVLAHEGFSSGRFYFEVQVKGKTDWDIGVARESIIRKGMITETPENGYWVVVMRAGNQYRARESPSVPLSLKVKPQIVGVFVDYEEGLVSFYDVEVSYLLFHWPDKLYPYFCPSENKDDNPLIISPVNYY